MEKLNSSQVTGIAFIRAGTSLKLGGVKLGHSELHLGS